MPERRLWVAGAGLLVALAGCGGGSQPGAAGSATAVKLTYSAGGVVKTRTLDCATPAANDKPSCDLLKKLPTSAFEPVPKGVACTMLYGGPEVATIKGSVNGAKVDATYRRTNGCEIDRFTKVEPLFAEMAGN